MSLIKKIRMESYYILVAAAFFAPFSMPTGRIFVAIAFLVFIAESIRKKEFPHFRAVVMLAFLWVAIACIVTMRGVHPEIGVHKLEKLIWFIAIPVTAYFINDYKRLKQMFYALVAGGGILAVKLVFNNTINALHTFHAGEFKTFTDAVINEGSMTDGQILAVCILAAMTILFSRTSKWKDSVFIMSFVSLLLQIFALIYNFKRGSWISLLLMLAIFIAVKVNWKSLLLMFVVVTSMFFLPPVQERLVSLKNEFNPDNGGRATMWIKIAPVLIKQYPGGIGYRSLTNEMMREIAPEVEPERDHLHSNLLQVLVATGWIGFAVYVLWMCAAFIDGLHYLFLCRNATDGENTFAFGLLLMLLVLYFNGLVEYNFGDAEIVLLYGFIMGGIVGGVRSEVRGRRSEACRKR